MWFKRRPRGSRSTRWELTSCWGSTRKRFWFRWATLVKAMVITCKKPCKKKRSTMLTVEQMVDIALGTPEIGAVNFNVLHALIHVIIQQLNIQKCLVEFKGYDSERMEGIILTAKPGPILKLSEYMIDVGDGKPCSQKDKAAKKGEDDVGGGSEATTSRRIPCECSGGKKKKSVDEEKEKTDKGKDDSDVEEKKKAKKEPVSEECEEVDEPEPKKIREFKPKTRGVDTKPCPCKSGTGGGVSDPEGVNADETLKVVPSSYYGSDTEGTCQTIVRVEPIKERCDSWRSRPALAHESMVKLEEKVAMLQDAFEALEQLPTNEELKKRTQGGTPTPTPVKDLWQLYNLNKRVESCEGTIEKLASMIEDLVKETCNFREAMLVIADAVDEMECADNTNRLTCCAALQGQANSPFQAQSLPPKGKPSSSGVQKSEGQTVSFSPCGDQPCPDDKEDPSKGVKATQAPAPPPTPTSASNTKPPESEKPNPEAPAAEESNATDQDKVERNSQSMEGPMPRQEKVFPGTGELLQGQPQQHVGIGPEFYKMSASEKFCTLKQHIDCLSCQLKNMTDNFPAQQLTAKLCALVSMQRQLDALEKEWRAFLASFGEEGITGLIKIINNMRNDIENLNTLVARLIMEKQETDEVIRNMLHEIDILKKTKADTEVVEDQLAEKADASLVNKKVSHDQFDAACDDLTRGLDEALEKLMQQEAMWNEAMEELQRDVDNKLDKTEIMPLKEFINKKLKCLQEKLKQLAQLKKDAEAAGAKSRILRNLNCIACDGDVVMKMDMTPLPRTSLFPSKTLKPMLTFELDQVRKAMKKGPPCRAVNHVEDNILDVQKKSAGIPLTAREAVDNKISKLAHFCNRYCGGSHTITTPQQRVTRIGHFLTEFGPQAMAMFNQENPCDGKSIQQGVTSSGVVTEEIDFRKSC